MFQEDLSNMHVDVVHLKFRDFEHGLWDHIISSTANVGSKHKINSFGIVEYDVDVDADYNYAVHNESIRTKARMGPRFQLLSVSI